METKEVKSLSWSDRFKKWYKNLPDSKRYIEFISAILGVPVLLTVLFLNFNNLKSNKVTPAPTPAAPSQIVVTIVPPSGGEKEREVPTATQAACRKEVGPVDISAPTEDQTLTQSPVCFTISYKDNAYCSVVWAYRIDNGPWSDFTDTSVCLYNLTNGSHKFELNVKSTVSTDQTNLVRNFVFQGPASPTPAPPTATPTTSASQ